MADRPLNPGQFKPEQLQMFMTGTELKDKINYSHDGNYDGSGMLGVGAMGALWKGKLKEAKRPAEPGLHGSGTYASIRERGWSPEYAGRNYGHVNLTHAAKPGAIPEWDRDQKSVDDGHHRIAAAADLEAKGKGPYYIPVQHWDNSFYR